MPPISARFRSNAGFPALLLISWMLNCSAHPYYFVTADDKYCTTPLVVGTVLPSMGTCISDGGARSILVYRGTTLLTAGDSYVPGESLTVKITPSIGEYCFHAVNAAFTGTNTGCGGTRTFVNSKTLVMPSNGEAVSLWAGWSLSRVPVKVTSTFTLAAPAVTTIAPTAMPTVVATSTPTRSPTTSAAPTRAPTRVPTRAPTSKPTARPSGPTRSPTAAPSRSPTRVPTRAPTRVPTTRPTARPSGPSRSPTPAPTRAPTRKPTARPSGPSRSPTPAPSRAPTRKPTARPSGPSRSPTPAPSRSPTMRPSLSPSVKARRSLRQ